jgi:hypothetical protein
MASRHERATIVIQLVERMNKAFTKESDNEDDDLDVADEPAHDPLAGARNYITPAGLQRLRDELRFLLTRERPAVTQVVAWAAGNGDRSENADYPSTASGGCGRSIGASGFSPNVSTPRKSWTRKRRERARPAPTSSSAQPSATPTPPQWSAS